MEKFFRPVHSPSDPAEMKLRKHHHHLHREDPDSHRFTLFHDSDINSEENQGHQYHPLHGHYLHDPQNGIRHHHQMHQNPHNEEDEILYNHNTPVTLSRASSSSLSSSASSVSSSSWFTEASGNDPFSLRHAERPQHSLSCSNIADVRREFREDENSEPIVFATVTHGSNGGSIHGSTQQRGRSVFSSLDRSHSRSEEGLLKANEGHNGRKQFTAQNTEQLYKTSRLNRSLTFSDEDLLLGDSRGPKRAVSSSQLPSKGILKNKEPNVDIRKAKSMEVISPRVPKRQDPSGQKGKVINQAEVEQAKADFFQGKLQFSAFLDEITKQVISPSHLTLLGVNNKVTSKPCAPDLTLDPVKPELPPKKHRKSSGSEREQCRKQQQNRQEKTVCAVSRKQSDGSNSDKLISYAARNHQGSPPPPQYDPNRNATHGRSRKGKRLSPIGGSLSEDRYGRCGSQLTDGTSTSPELNQPKLRHHRKQQTHAFSSPHTQNCPQPQPKYVHTSASQRRPNTSPPPTAPGARMGLGSESSSSKSDSPRTRDTTSTTTSHSSEQSVRHHSVHVGTSKQCRDRLFDGEQLKVLQEENSDLHQNLLQTVVCIESLESELQRTRDELSNVKDKYKSLLESHTGTRQANNMLGENLHIASESISSERKYLLTRVTQLTSELEDAHRTIAALENINLPCLIKDLLAKHFNSSEAVQKFLTPTTVDSLSASSPPSIKTPHTPKSEETGYKWLTESETATAFVPFKQEAPKTGVQVSLQRPQSSNSPPFSVEDISTTIYQKILANYTAKPQNYQQQSALSVKHNESPLKPQQLHSAEHLDEKGELLVTLLEQDAVEVDSVSAQQILDEFLQQLHTRERVGEGKEQDK
ncbi:uncharacterized protein si:ch211-276i12.4 [Corythoichthys intestinalis]|uniref:uncharacterized protein si:ch211-276i12.4 n=1 Tax=Corythoichthys intestinalis TaxID=161448 RepID=UPI0025A58351|nr:uncharacterized protein si:ch211-276i12.4 [Corythoichthys intestinalis]